MFPLCHLVQSFGKPPGSTKYRWGSVMKAPASTRTKRVKLVESVLVFMLYISSLSCDLRQVCLRSHGAVEDEVIRVTPPLSSTGTRTELTR